MEKIERAVLQKPVTNVGFFANSAMAMEHFRIAVQLRTNQLKKNGYCDTDTEELLRRSRELEVFVDNHLKEYLTNHPTYSWWSRISGCHPESIGKILGEIEDFWRFYKLGDPMIPFYVKRDPVKDEAGEYWTLVTGIERLVRPSALRKFANLCPDGKSQEGKTRSSNKDLRTLFFRLGYFGFFMKKNKYYKLYLAYKEWKTKKLVKDGVKILPTPKGRFCPTCKVEKEVPKDTRYCPVCNTKLGKKIEPPGVVWEGHLDFMARRRMMQIFSDHLWAVWREALKLPLCEPQTIEFLREQGRPHIIKPWDMCDN